MVDNTSMYTFRIPVGDYSGDGHGQCLFFVIHSNVSRPEFTRMLQSPQVLARFGFRPSSMCADYEQSWYDEEQTAALKDIIIRVAQTEEPQFDDQEFANSCRSTYAGEHVNCFSWGQFGNMYRLHALTVLEMLKEVFPHFEYSMDEEVECVWASLGGYGLFLM